MLPDWQLDFAKRSEPKFVSFAQKLPDLAHALVKLMQLKHVTDET